jgi:hypothetical protein
MGRKIIAVAAVLGLLAYLFWPRRNDLRHDVPTDVQTCKRHMLTIYKGLLELHKQTGELPRGPGPTSIAGLIGSGIWENTKANRELLTCPGPRAQPLPADIDFTDTASLGDESSAYACRNQADFPLSKFPDGGASNEPILSCDNAAGMNHEGVMNVLYSDGSIVTLHLDQEIGRGRVPAGSTTIVVGKDSPIDDLKKLR